MVSLKVSPYRLLPLSYKWRYFKKINHYILETCLIVHIVLIQHLLLIARHNSTIWTPSLWYKTVSKIVLVALWRSKICGQTRPNLMSCISKITSLGARSSSFKQLKRNTVKQYLKLGIRYEPFTSLRNFKLLTTIHFETFHFIRSPELNSPLFSFPFPIDQYQLSTSSWRPLFNSFYCCCLQLFWTVIAWNLA